MSKRFYIDDAPNGPRYFIDGDIVPREVFERRCVTECEHFYNHHNECRDCGMPRREWKIQTVDLVPSQSIADAVAFTVHVARPSAAYTLKPHVKIHDGYIQFGCARITKRAVEALFSITGRPAGWIFQSGNYESKDPNTWGHTTNTAPAKWRAK